MGVVWWGRERGEEGCVEVEGGFEGEENGGFVDGWVGLGGGRREEVGVLWWV